MVISREPLPRQRFWSRDWELAFGKFGCVHKFGFVLGLILVPITPGTLSVTRL